MSKLDAETAPGPDRLPYALWTTAAPPWRSLLLRCFETIRQLAVVPAEWRHALIKPLFKDGDPTLFPNYRPIALMCTATKVFEALLLPRLRRLLEPGLSPAQFGFRYGAEEAVASLTAVLEHRRAPGLPTWCGFLDVVKAYDIVWREGCSLNSTTEASVARRGECCGACTMALHRAQLVPRQALPRHGGIRRECGKAQS